MKCERRHESAACLSDDEDYWFPDNTCSFCGSLNPDVLMARIEVGDVELGPTDKSYKVYVENKGGEKFPQVHSRKCPDVMKCDRRTCTHWTHDTTDHTKFYFMHFSQEQMVRFVELYNQKKLKVGYPGHFYVMPFFMRRA